MNRRKFINYTSLSFGASMIPDLKFKEIREEEKEVSGIRIVAPSIIEVNEEFEIGVSILTTPFYASTKPNWHNRRSAVAGPFNLSPRGIRYMQNVMQEWEGVVEIIGDKDYDGPLKYNFSDGMGPNEDDKRAIRRIGGIKFQTAGVKYIQLKDVNNSIIGISNPIQVYRDKPVEKLFWGDLHMHSIYTDGIRIPEQVYSFARNESFLDICAMSDHSEGLSDIQWEHFKHVTNHFNEPGRFVTLVGGEWTSMEFGHRNYYYRGSDGPILQCNSPNYQDLKQFYSAARKHSALVIPHHSASAAMGVDWDLGHDSIVERLVEIHSIWGNSERPKSEGNPIAIQLQGGEKEKQHVVDALGKGYKLGFIAGGDIHDGRPGDELHNLQDKPDSYYLTRRQGIMGVWAKELTREAIFDALWNRQVYGTTNHRTILKFSINGFRMGAEIKTNTVNKIKVKVISDQTIEKIELIKNGKDVQLFKPDSNDMDVLWETNESMVKSNAYYYVRVTLADGENMAWSSPIWINSN